MTTPFKKGTIILLLIIFAILSATTILERGLNPIGLSRLGHSNDGYLERAFAKSVSGFLILSGIKSGLAVVEGSSVGVGFSLEVGDVVQPIYDAVDIAWRAAMAGGGVIVFMQMTLKAVRIIDHWALAAWLGLAAVALAARWGLPDRRGLSTRLDGMTRIGAAIAIACYLILPLTITAATALSARITAPVVDEAQEELKRFGHEISPDNLSRRFFNQENDGGAGLFDLKNRLSQVGDGLKTLSSFLSLQSERITGLLFKLITAYVFDCILFPLLFGLVLTAMVRSGISWLLDPRKRLVDEGER
jgi:hypothetical protein